MRWCHFYITGTRERKRDDKFCRKEKSTHKHLNRDRDDTLSHITIMSRRFILQFTHPVLREKEGGK